MNSIFFFSLTHFIDWLILFIFIIRNYPQKKINENIECEIMQVVLQEAYESYKPEIIMVLDSNTVEDMENNVVQIQNWINEKKNNMNQWKSSSIVNWL